jgi:hypothetical protein
MAKTQVEHRTQGSALLWSALSAAIVAGTYWAFLGWDRRKDLNPATGELTGPYQPWQVIGCGAVLTLLAFEAGRRGRIWPVALVLPTVLTASFAISAATDSESDGLWPIGAALVALGSSAGTAAVAALGAALAQARRT